MKSGVCGRPTWKRFAIICLASAHGADTCASAAVCRTTSLSVTPKIASAKATLSTGRLSMASWSARRSCALIKRSGASRRHSGATSTQEAAFSVEEDYRRRGIGEDLFKRILRAATNHGVETIEIVCLPENVGMQNLAKKFHTHFAFEGNSLTGRLTARRPNYALSLIREA